MKISEIFWKKDEYKAHTLSYETPVDEGFGDEAFSIIVNGQEWKFTAEEMYYDEDTRKTFHNVTAPTGDKHFMDWSPYSNPSKTDVALFIRLGTPTRGQLGLRGPFGHNDLIKQARKKGIQIK